MWIQEIIAAIFTKDLLQHPSHVPEVNLPPRLPQREVWPLASALPTGEGIFRPLGVVSHWL